MTNPAEYIPDEVVNCLARYKCAALATRSQLDALARHIGGDLPRDFCLFYTVMGAGEGFVGAHYLVMERVDRLARLNAACQVSRNAPGLFAFGGDGGGELFAFDCRTVPWPIVCVPLIGMSLTHARPVANTLFDLIVKMFSCSESLF